MRGIFFHARKRRRSFAERIFLGAARRAGTEEGGYRKGGEGERGAVSETRTACRVGVRHSHHLMDVSIIFKLAAIGILVTVVCQILKKSDRDDISTVVSIVGLVIALTIAVTMIGDLFETIRDIFQIT